MKEQKVIVVGATEAVDEELLNVLDELDFLVESILSLVNAKSAGSEVEFRGKSYKVKELTEEAFEQNPIDIALFSAGGSTSAKYAKSAVETGAVVIDNTSHFGVNQDAPLVVPKCNAGDIKLWEKTGIITDSNCSAVQMVHILRPLDEVFKFRRVNVTTYQAAGGADREGMAELVEGLQSSFAFKLDEFKASTFSYTLALNLILQIDGFNDNDYTKEELKMVNKTQEIPHKNLEISATYVHVGVLRSHNEALSLHFEREVDARKAKGTLRKTPSAVVINDVTNKKYPMPLFASDTNETYVGRAYKDTSRDSVLHLWCMADQVRIGTATNAVRIIQR